MFLNSRLNTEKICRVAAMALISFVALSSCANRGSTSEDGTNGTIVAPQLKAKPFPNLNTFGIPGDRKQLLIANGIIGHDLSHYNTIQNWDSLKTAFLYLKATEGMDMKDEKYSGFLKEARKRSIPVGAYHYLTTSTKAKDQFDNYKSVVDAASIDLVPVLDIEKQSKGNVMDTLDLQNHVLEWVSLCEEHYGVKPMIYTSIQFYKAYLEGVVDGCLLWFGNVDCPLSYIESVPWDIWQYTVKKTKGSVGGIDHNLLHENRKLDDFMVRKKDL